MASRGWSKGSLLMAASGAAGNRSLTVAALIGLHGCKLSRDRQGAVSLHPRDGPFETGDEVEFRRRVAEHFLILAIERIAQVAVDSYAAAERVIHIDTCIGESGIPE